MKRMSLMKTPRTKIERFLLDKAAQTLGGVVRPGDCHLQIHVEQHPGLAIGFLAGKLMPCHCARRDVQFQAHQATLVPRGAVPAPAIPIVVVAEPGISGELMAAVPLDYFARLLESERRLRATDATAADV